MVSRRGKVRGCYSYKNRRCKCRCLRYGGCKWPARGRRKQNGLDGQAFTAFGAACVDYSAAAACFHANQKTVGAGAAGFGGLVSAFHGFNLSKFSNGCTPCNASICQVSLYENPSISTMSATCLIRKISEKPLIIPKKQGLGKFAPDFYRTWAKRWCLWGRIGGWCFGFGECGGKWLGWRGCGFSAQRQANMGVKAYCMEGCKNFPTMLWQARVSATGLFFKHCLFTKFKGCFDESCISIGDHWPHTAYPLCAYVCGHAASLD